MNLKVSFKEAVTGISRSFTVNSTNPCETCKGSGDKVPLPTRLLFLSFFTGRDYSEDMCQVQGPGSHIASPRLLPRAVHMFRLWYCVPHNLFLGLLRKEPDSIGGSGQKSTPCSPCQGMGVVRANREVTLRTSLTRAQSIASHVVDS